MIPGNAGSVDPGEHRIDISPNHPFAPPAVTPLPLREKPHWHMESNGRLCIYSQAQRAGRPWENIDDLFGKVASWHEQDEAGWPDDPGDLDLERYFPDTGTTLVLFESFDQLLGRRLQVQRSVRTWTVEPGSLLSSKNRGVQKRERRARNYGDPWAIAVDLGTLDRPIVTWPEIRDHLSPAFRKHLTESGSLQRQGLLLARYKRPIPDGGRSGVVAIQLLPAVGRTPSLVALPSEDRGVATRNRRGQDAALLAQRHVAIVGIGAVGSFVADLLARSGVGRMTLVDGDVMRVGNSIRHVLDPASANKLKASALKASLDTRQLLPARSVTAVDRILDPEILWRLFAECDLVVNATAAPDVNDMFEHLGEVSGEQWIEVALYRAGAVARADRLGAGTTTEAARPPKVTSVPGDEGVRETGCGDPVSPTPPASVLSAASLAARLTIDSFRSKRQRQLPDAIVEVLAPTAGGLVPAGDPYTVLGTVLGP